jgi:hypothetical protein
MDSRHHFADDAYRRLNITRLPKDGLGYLARGERLTRGPQNLHNSLEAAPAREGGLVRPSCRDSPHIESRIKHADHRLDVFRSGRELGSLIAVVLYLARKRRKEFLECLERGTRTFRHIWARMLQSTAAAPAFSTDDDFISSGLEFARIVPKPRNWGA